MSNLALDRSDFVGSYHSADYDRSRAKQEQREKVLDFMLPHLAGTKTVKLLSMPGVSWTFEQMLLREHQRSQIVGLEHSRSAYLRARRSIPVLAGSMEHPIRGMQERERPFGNGYYIYSRATALIPKRISKYFDPLKHAGNKKSNRSHRLLQMCANTYLTMFTTDYRATIEQKGNFHSRFYGRNAVWLDFTSNLCASVEECLRNLPICIYPSYVPKPVIITILNARDSFHGTENRVAHILKLQPALVYEKHWTYKGKGDVPMLTVCGTIV